MADGREEKAALGEDENRKGETPKGETPAPKEGESFEKGEAPKEGETFEREVAEIGEVPKEGEKFEREDSEIGETPNEGDTFEKSAAEMGEIVGTEEVVKSGQTEEKLPVGGAGNLLRRLETSLSSVGQAEGARQTAASGGIGSPVSAA